MNSVLSQRPVFHLLPNAHLDPVWLWDWREGLNEGLITVRSILDLMDEFPQLTFIRGESSIYEHIEKTDPATFDRIRKKFQDGRWDIIGGTYNQPDTNLASTETLCRQYERGLAYFDSRFSFIPNTAWQADSFGHTPGLPNILSSFGMKNFAFTRPARSEFAMPEPAFWWEGDHGNKILCYRQHYIAYCSERDNLHKILNLTLEQSRSHPHRHVAVLMGLGNHGGGPSRRHILDAESWAASHPEIEVRYSTLHGFFKTLHAEIGEKSLPIPTLRGDMGFCLRGCYSSVMKFKSAYRKAEALVSGAEATQSVISSTLQTEAKSLTEAWDGILFNSFHDILPGSSIERAFDEQLAWVGHSVHAAETARFHALNQLALRVDSTVPQPKDPERPADVPMLLWNPLPRPYKGWVELEACLDYRPLWTHTAAIGSLPLSLVFPGKGNLPFQEIDTEHHSMRDGAWRKRLAVYTEIPALGWKLLHLGYRDKPAKKPRATKSDCLAKGGKSPSIQNKLWKLNITPAGLVEIRHKGKKFLGGKGALSIHSIDDIYGSWGGMKEEKEAIQTESVRDVWKIRKHSILEEGPERVALWTRWEGGKSWMDLTFYLARDAREIRVKARLLWNERSARLKMVLPCEGPLEMQVPGSRIKRPQPGHLPAGRWLRRGPVGFVSDVLSDVDASKKELRVTLARATRFANDVPTQSGENPWQAATDCGELKFEFWLSPGNADLERLAQELLQPPVVLRIPSHRGSLSASGSLARLEPETTLLLAAKQSGTGNLALRIQNSSSKATENTFHFNNTRYPLGTLEAQEIKTITIPVSHAEKLARIT